MDILTFIAVLAVAAATTWLIHTHLTTRKAHDEALKAAALLKVDEYLNKFEKMFKQDITTLTSRVVEHDETISKVKKDLLATAPQRMGGIADRFAHIQKK